MTLDLDVCLEKLNEGKLLSEAQIRFLCSRSKEMLMQEQNVKRLRTPLTIVGDLHGQFYDVMEMFRIGGRPPDTNYLFLGDYVDRGHFSVETISLLICLKLRYPERVHMLRGNHESRQISRVYGFYQECEEKYGSVTVWRYFMELFDYLTVSATIDDRIFCVHGGISPSIHTLDQIRILDRFNELPTEGPLADFMWSDPDTGKTGFSVSPRGAGYIFGEDVFNKFMYVNRLDCMLRAHQLCMEGFQEIFGGKCITIWSAPNYCYRYKNAATILEVDTQLNRRFNVFSWAPENERHSQRDFDNSHATESNEMGGLRKLQDSDTSKLGSFTSQYFM